MKRNYGSRLAAAVAIDGFSFFTPRNTSYRLYTQLIFFLNVVKVANCCYDFHFLSERVFRKSRIVFQGIIGVRATECRFAVDAC